MTTKTELNAYFATLKGVAKDKTSPLRNAVFIRNNTVKAATNKVFVCLDTFIKGDGEYRLNALDAYAVDGRADLSVYRVTSDYSPMETIENHTLNFSETRPLNETLIEKLLKAYEFVSTDPMRAALQQVVLKDGWVLATDGFRAYVEKSGLPTTVNAYFSPVLMATLKRLYKYGNWSFTIGTAENNEEIVRICNEQFSLTEFQCTSTYPELHTVLNLTTPYDRMIKLPVKNLLKVTDTHHQTARIQEDDIVWLGGNWEDDFLQTPMKATVEVITPKLAAKDYDKRIVVMPMSSKDGWFSVNLALLKNLTDKDGNVTLLWVKGTMNPLLVVE